MESVVVAVSRHSTLGVVAPRTSVELNILNSDMGPASDHLSSSKINHCGVSKSGVYFCCLGIVAITGLTALGIASANLVGLRPGLREVCETPLDPGVCETCTKCAPATMCFMPSGAGEMDLAKAHDFNCTDASLMALGITDGAAECKHMCGALFTAGCADQFTQICPTAPTEPREANNYFFGSRFDHIEYICVMASARLVVPHNYC
jgi:hypothetical protein